MATDYDCWKKDEVSVNVENVIKIFQENADKVKKVILHAVELIGARNWDTEINELNVSWRGGVVLFCLFIYFFFGKTFYESNN